MAIYDFFVSRNGAAANAAAYVGHVGRLFYDSTNGVIKLSDGVTPGGTFIPYNIASNVTVGGIKAGPGANVSTDGTLTINTAGLPLSFGNLSVNDNILSTVNANADLVLQSNGTGNVELVGNVSFYSTAQGHTGTPFFHVQGDGQATFLVPASDPLAGAFKIVGSSTGSVSAPLNTGVMLQLTGNNNDASRFYNDAIGSFAAFVGRRINGTVASPTAVTAGQEIIRISATGYNGTSIPTSAGARINFAAAENYTTANFGSNIGFWACPTGSNVLVKQATIDGQSGLTVTMATVTGNLTVGNIAVSGSGTITTPRVVFNDGGIRSIQSGIYANISFATDSIVHLYQPSGDVNVNLSGYTAGAIVRLMINMAAARAVNLGVTATNSTNGSTQLAAAKISNNQAVQIIYTCIDGTSANCHAALSYA